MTAPVIQNNKTIKNNKTMLIEIGDAVTPRALFNIARPHLVW
jgi:hypothetical protein